LDSIIFLLVAVALYFASDFLLQALEMRLGRRLEHRSLIFFALLLILSLVSFAVIRHVLPS
jgi:hypothetical protein